MRVLTVADDAEMRRVLRKLFQGEEWAAEEAATVAQGLIKLETSPDWVLLDLAFTGSRGEIILWKIRSERLPIRVAVIASSEQGARQNAVRGLKPDLLLEKPIDGASLVAALRESSPDEAACFGELPW